MENKLPEGWEWKKLGEIAEINPKFDKKSVSESTEVTFLPMKCIEELTGNVDTSITKSLEEVSKGYTPLIENDLIYAKITPCMENGKAAIATGLKNNLGFASTEFHVIRFKKNAYNKFFFFYLIQKRIREHAAMNMTGSAGQKRVPATFLKNLLVPLPPLETQKKIVSILEKAEETRKLRAQADELTQKLLQSVFLEIFGDPVTNPMGWNTEKLEKLCVKIYGGGTPSKSKPEYYEGDIPWVTPKDMKQDFIQDSIDHISEKAIEESSTKLIPPYSLLMVIRSGILKHTLPIAINNCKVTMNQDMKGFVFDDKLTNSFFMLYYFKIYQRDLLNRVRSVTADNLEFSQIKDIDVILPPIKQQQRFTTIVEQLDRTRSNQQQSSLEINSLFDALMQKAFTGKLVS